MGNHVMLGEVLSKPPISHELLRLALRVNNHSNHYVVV